MKLAYRDITKQAQYILKFYRNVMRRELPSDPVPVHSFISLTITTTKIYFPSILNYFLYCRKLKSILIDLPLKRFCFLI